MLKKKIIFLKWNTYLMIEKGRQSAALIPALEVHSIWKKQDQTTDTQKSYATATVLPMIGHAPLKNLNVLEASSFWALLVRYELSNVLV